MRWIHRASSVATHTSRRGYGNGAPGGPERVRQTVLGRRRSTRRLRRPTTARLAIDRHGAQVLARVTDRGRGTPVRVGPPGRGLAGMRRRVEGLNGRLEVGPRDRGGFQVEAWLPVREAIR
jgi:hypothetical protein